MKSNFMRSAGSRVGGSAASGVNNARVERSAASKAVQKLGDVSHLSRQALSQLKERPKLIAELSDSHRTVNSLMLAIEQLKLVARAALEIKQRVASARFSPSDLNQIDVHKRTIMNAVNAQLFGYAVLDSSFCPVGNTLAEVEFQVPGLDLVRERLTNELVTLYINNRMIPLAFDRVESNQGLFEQFAVTFSYAQMRLRVDDQQALVIAMRDDAWRKWDLNVHVSGQGGRYPQGSPITVNAQSLHPTVEMITMLDVRASDAIAAIDRVIARVNDMHHAALAALDTQGRRSQQLMDFCHRAPSEIGETIKSLFVRDGRVALGAIVRHYVGPNRDNVISLIKK